MLRCAQRLAVRAGPCGDERGRAPTGCGLFHPMVKPLSCCQGPSRPAPISLCPSSLQQPHWQHACPASPPPPQKLYFCEYDLQFFRHRHQMLRHLKKVKLLHPPGTEIYRNGNISMFEVGASLQV